MFRRNNSPISLGLCFLLAVVLVRADYWVSTTGSDTSGTGTAASPFATLAKAASKVTATSPPTTIYVAPGTYNVAVSMNGVSNVAFVGSSSSWPTLRQGSTTAPGFYFYNTANITVSNFKMIGAGNTGQTAKAGISFWVDATTPKQKITLTNLEISYFYEGIQVFANTNTGYNNVLIENVYSHHNRDNGGSTYAPTKTITNVIVRNCTFSYNLGDSTKFKPSGSGFVLGGVNGGLMERCIAYSNGGLSPNTAGPVGLWTYSSNNVIIQFSESYNNSAKYNDGDGFDLDVDLTNSIIQYCYSHGNKGAGYLMSPDGTTTYSNNTVRFCISENDGNAAAYGGLQFYGPAANSLKSSRFYGNTVYNSNGRPSVYIAGGTNVVSSSVVNNIFYTTGSPFVTADSTSWTTSNINFQSNLYYTTSGTGNFNGKTSLTAWQSIGQEKLSGVNVGIQANPLLVAPGSGGTVGDTAKLSTKLGVYRLNASSPAIAAGLNYATVGIANPGQQDFFGVQIPINSKYEIGAAAYVAPSVSVSPSPTRSV